MASSAESAKATPKLDLESYISNYDGPLRLERLITIASSQSHLATEAHRLAVIQAKKGINVESYIAIATAFQSVAPDDPLAAIDTEWATATTKRVKSETDRLEHELKAYKNNLIKESIRMGNEDLGNHYFAIGECGKAGQYYTKMREFCTTPKHIAEMTLKLLYVTITQKSWTTANSYRLKMSGMGFREEERTNKYDPLLNACEGLIRLSSGSYREAAEAFLSVDPSYMTLEPQAGISFQRRVISPNDVAIYGGICALATMDSAELKSKVLENQPFRQYLELESHLRRAISMFCSSKFTGCLGVLDSYTADYKLDVYLQPHLERLYHMIRSKSLVQWFSAFSVVSLDEVTRAFPSLEGNVIVEELEEMIKSGTLDARIDLVDNLLLSPNPDPRLIVLEETLAMAKAQERALRLRLHRINLLSAGLEVSGSRNHPQASQTSFGPAESGRGFGMIASKFQGKKKAAFGGSHMV